MVNRNSFGLAQFVAVIFVTSFCTNSFAATKFFLLGAGSPPSFGLTKYASGADACIAAKDEDDREMRESLLDLTGTWTFLQWPDENIYPDLASQTYCKFSFTGSWTVPFPGGFYDDTRFNWVVIAGSCPNGQSVDTVTHQCVGYSISTLLAPQCNSCVQNYLKDPINPATGAMFDTKSDVAGSNSLSFKRFYNSTDTGVSKLSSGWEHSFSRSVIVRFSTITSEPFVSSSNTSSQYPSPGAACTTGFAEIKANAPQWNDALTSYSNGNCLLTKSGVYIGSIVVKASGAISEVPSGPVAYDVIRDDGQLVRFIVNSNGAIINPPGTSLKLQKTQTGFIVTDGDDNTEQYDSSGKLLTVASRGGVVQTMSYDGAGRLSGVSDSFGHQLTFDYDAQGRLASVTQL